MRKSDRQGFPTGLCYNLERFVSSGLYETGMRDKAGNPERYPAFTLASADEMRTAKAMSCGPNTDPQDATVASKRDLAIATLCKITKTEADYVSTQTLAIEMYPQDPGEDAGDYVERIKIEAEELSRSAQGANAKRRGKRPNLSDLIQKDRNGSPLRTGRSVRFFVPDAIRTEYAAF
jgi:hypothetical protein